MISRDQKHDSIDDYVDDLTGDIPVSEESKVESVGERIRNLREEKGLSLEELANLTGFEIDLLMKIEEGKIQPQLGTSLRLSKALDGAFSRIVSGVGNRLYSITRRDERKAISRSTSKKGNKQLYSYLSLAPEVKGRNMEALIVHLEPVDPDSEAISHNGEEFIYVLDGTAALTIGEEEYDLEPGDSIYYLSTTPHKVGAKNEKATILAVVYSGE